MHNKTAWSTFSAPAPAPWIPVFTGMIVFFVSYLREQVSRPTGQDGVLLVAPNHRIETDALLLRSATQQAAAHVRRSVAGSYCQ